MAFGQMNWRETYKESGDVHRRSDILRAVLTISRSPKEISDIVYRMESLPEGLQSYIAWDVVCNPATTIEIYERVKNNCGLLHNTSAENVQSAWERNRMAYLNDLGWRIVASAPNKFGLCTFALIDASGAEVARIDEPCTLDNALSAAERFAALEMQAQSEMQKGKTE